MENVHLIENHDKALEIWHDNGVYEDILVHIDAHLDYVSVKDAYYINIGNYLTYAIRENLFRKFYWVVPDIFWKDFSYGKMIIQKLPRCFEVDDMNDKMIRLKNNEFHHRELVIVGISNIALIVDEFRHDKLICVDIDTDFMMNPVLFKNYSYGHPPKSWCTAYDLYSRLVPLIKSRHIITIANSFYGGYTPLLYAYLSEYLYTLFRNKSEKKYDNFELLENGSRLLIENNYAEAIKCYKQVEGSPLAFLSAQIGLLYSYISICNLCDAKEVYSSLQLHFKRYEAYYFPISILLLNKQIDLAKKLINQWLQVASLSEQANLFFLKYVNCTMSIQGESEIQKYASKITDLGTNYEKSYILGNIYLQRLDYQNSIDSFALVLNFLRNSSTPVWCGQISSFEKYKNHGVIISDIYKKLARAYAGLKNYKAAQKYARIYKRIEQI